MTDFWQEFSYTLWQNGVQQLALVLLAHSGDQSVINQERLQTESEENWSFEKRCSLLCTEIGLWHVGLD